MIHAHKPQRSGKSISSNTNNPPQDPPPPKDIPVIPPIKSVVKPKPIEKKIITKLPKKKRFIIIQKIFTKILNFFKRYK